LGKTQIKRNYPFEQYKFRLSVFQILALPCPVVLGIAQAKFEVANKSYRVRTMNALTLQWHDAGQEITRKIYEQQPTKNPGTVRIGRDPARCDIIISNPTVSGLHIEIYFYPEMLGFFIRNLRSQNPPLVDGQQLIQGEMLLKQGSIICLGQMELKVIAVDIIGIPATIFAPPQPPVAQYPPTPPIKQAVYAIECPKCHRVSPYEHQHLPCRWCGTSLAAGMSVLVEPQ
jgi:hypothetical protein